LARGLMRPVAYGTRRDGRAVRSMPTFVVDAETQQEILEQFQRRCLHFSEAHQQTARPLCFSARAYQKPHPEKEISNPCDADATLATPMLLGVCDGVSQVDELGLDPSELPKELLSSCEDIVTRQLLADVHHRSLQSETEDYSGPISLLKEAYTDTESLGSTSVLLAVMDNSTQIHGKLHPMIGVVTMGDCELVLLRRSGADRRFQVVLHTEMQRIGNNRQTPLQLLRMDEDLDPGFSEDGALDAIEHGSGLHCTSTYEGDILILGSDGVFDNLFLGEVVAVCDEQLPPRLSDFGFEPASPSRLSGIARTLVEKAHSKCMMGLGGPTQLTPVGEGGKVDDTSVVIAEVIEWTPTLRQAWAKAHKRPSAFSSLFSCGSTMCKPKCRGYMSEAEWDEECDAEEDPNEACSIL